MRRTGISALLALLAVQAVLAVTATSFVSVNPNEGQAGDTVVAQVTGLPATVSPSAFVTLIPVDAANGSPTRVAADLVLRVAGSTDLQVRFRIPDTMARSRAYPAAVVVETGAATVETSTAGAPATTIMIQPSAAITGLALSLLVRRRRVWVKVSASPEGDTVVEVAGMTRSEHASVSDDVEALVAELSY